MKSEPSDVEICRDAWEKHLRTCPHCSAQKDYQWRAEDQIWCAEGQILNNKYRGSIIKSLDF